MAIYPLKLIKDMDEWASFAKTACQKSVDLGADQVKTVGHFNQGIRIVIENGDLKLSNTYAESSWGQSLIKDQRRVSISFNQESPEALEKQAKEALETSKWSHVDPHYQYLSKEQAQPCRFDFNIVDPKGVEMKAEDFVAFSKLILEAFKKHPKIALDRLEVNCDFGCHALATSKDLFRTERQTTLSYSFLCFAKDGDKVSGMDYDQMQSFDMGTMVNGGDGFGDIERFCQKLERALQTTKAEKYHGVVCLSPACVQDLILDYIFFKASGRQIMDKKSDWRDKVGEKVAHASLQIEDIFSDLRLGGVTAYDLDGAATAERVYVKDGQLQSLVLDQYSASRLEMPINHTAGGPFALRVGGGEDPIDDLLQAHPKILLLDRFSGNLDFLTGDFSGVAKSSQWYENGQYQGTVGETMVAGNCEELLQKIIGLSQETEIVSASYEAPYILVDGISVS